MNKFRMVDHNGDIFYGNEAIVCYKQQVAFDEKNIDVVRYDHIGYGCHFNQCIGITDKNENDIYEGDTVRYKTFSGYNYGIVTYIKERMAYMLFNAGEKYCICSDMVLEVVGNIYKKWISECPSCKSENIELMYDPSEVSYHYECFDCGCRKSKKGSQEKALSDWNKRV